MLRWSLILLGVALVAAMFRFTGIAAVAAGIARKRLRSRTLW
jgi:uncharacterized membrane protein YtjA (UPF0391 family)